MGTKAVFAIGCDFQKETFYNSTILGVTSDGHLDNHLCFVDCVKAACKSLNIPVSSINGNNFKEVLVRAEQNQDWFFVDKLSNAQFVRYSSIFYPKENKLVTYSEMFECKLQVIDLTNNSVEWEHPEIHSNERALKAS